MIDVVIPYFDDVRLLEAILVALSRQHDHRGGGPLRDVRIVVADDASVVRPPARLLGGDVTTVRSELVGYHPSTARNLGARSLDGDVIVFLDGDTVPAPDYVSRLVEPVLSGTADLTTGRRRHGDLDGLSPVAIADFAGHPTPERLLPEPQWLARGQEWTDRLRSGTSDTYQYVISAVLTVRRESFESVGGFEERFDSYGGEDWEFAYRCWNDGWDLLHVPEAHAFHDGPDVEGRPDDHDVKTVESLRIVELVPASSTRLSGVVYEVPDLEIELTVAHGDLTSSAVAVHSLLSQRPGDLRLRLVGDADVVGRLSDLVHDPRLVPVELPAASSARCVVTVSGPAEFGVDALAELSADVADGRLAERRVQVGDVEIVARSNRLRRRSARHPSDHVRSRSADREAAESVPAEPASDPSPDPSPGHRATTVRPTPSAAFASWSRHRDLQGQAPAVTPSPAVALEVDVDDEA